MANILIISSTSFFGGAEQFIVNTLSRLEERHTTLYLINSKDLAEKLIGTETILFESQSFISQVKQIKNIAKMFKPDLIIFNGSNIAYSLPLFRRCKTVYYRHTTNKYAPRNRRWLFKILMNLIYRNATLTIHVSDYSLSEQKHGVGMTIHNGIKPHSTNHERDYRLPLRFLFCGRLEKAKGIREIVSAFRSIDPSTASLTIIGTGTEADWVKDNLADNIRYCGFQKDVDAFYESSDVLILMSEFENFPISVIEALNHGLPVVTTGAGGISEMVKDGYNGKIIPSTIAAIEEAVNDFAMQPSLLREMSINARAFCRDELNVNDKIQEINNAVERIVKL